MALTGTVVPLGYLAPFFAPFGASGSICQIITHLLAVPARYTAIGGITISSLPAYAGSQKYRCPLLPSDSEGHHK